MTVFRDFTKSNICSNYKNQSLLESRSSEIWAGGLRRGYQCGDKAHSYPKSRGHAMTVRNGNKHCAMVSRSPSEKAGHQTPKEMGEAPVTNQNWHLHKTSTVQDVGR